jgi:hypothetical protein
MISTICLVRLPRLTHAFGAAAEVAGDLILGQRSGEESAAQRTVGDEPDAEFGAGGHDVVLDVARPQAPLGLDRGDRVDGVGSAEFVGGDLGEPDVADLAGLDEFGHRADGLLDGNLGIGTVEIVEIDRLHAEAAERCLAR